MDDRTPTVGELVARFQLRRRASTEAFTAGVRLARAGGVTLGSLTDDRVDAEVHDPSVLAVELYVDNGSLVGHCTCLAAAHSVCRHQVAVAHAVWVERRRHPGRNRSTAPDDQS